MDYSNVPIPQAYTEAIESAMQQYDRTVSTVRLNQVLAQLPADQQDKPAANYFLRAYKAQNKRVSPLAALLSAVNGAIETLPEDSLEREYLLTAVKPFVSTTTEGAE